MKKQTISRIEGVVSVAASVAALSAAGYLLFGPQGKKNRKVVKGWTLQAKGELLQRLENMSDVTSATYSDAVSEVMKKYAELKTITPDEIKKLSEEFHKSWKSIVRDATPKKKNLAKVIKKKLKK